MSQSFIRLHLKKQVLILNFAVVDVYSFFYHAVPPDSGALTLEELHDIVKNIWLTRHDIDLEAEQAARRKGRPKSAKELKLEEIKLREAEEYRTGMGQISSRFHVIFSNNSSITSSTEVIDLTHTPTVELFRKWDQKEFAYIQMLRFIRISSSDPTIFAVSKPGKHRTLCNNVNVEHSDSSQDQEMDIPTRQEFLGEPISRFSSTMMTMDGPT